MKLQQLTSMSALLALCLLSGCASTSSKAPQVTEDGLEKVDVKGIDVVYRRPGAQFGQYDKFLVRPVEVAFHKDWEPEKQSAMYSMHPPDREQIKQTVAETFQEVLKEELEKKGGYKIVDEPGPDVLELRTAIVDIYINAPDVSMQVPGRVKTYSADTGHMTLVAELHDSITGAVLARAYDGRSGNGSGYMHWSTSTWNLGEARRIMQIWADALRERLDAARGVSTKK